MYNVKLKKMLTEIVLWKAIYKHMISSRGRT